jgi:hypothetical protein
VAYWEFVANQDATYQAGYSLSTATRQDSVGGNTNQHYFMVLAHTSDPFVFFESNPDSGYSVDNLSPGAPMMLTALRVGDDVELSWSPSETLDPDLKEYAVYRSSTSGVTPDPLFYVTSNSDTMLTDVGAPESVLYYVVTAVDVHLNESGPSNEAMAKAVPTAADDRTPALTSLQVQPNVPNPFSATTELRVGLPAQADVRVDVFDVAGRRVASRDVGRRSAGWQSVRFDGRDDAGRQLPSGVYFYRIRAGSETLTRKMVLHR